MGTGPRSTVKEFRSNPLPIVWITPKAYYMMSLWAELAGKVGYEFTCLGRAIERDGNIYVTDAYAVKHEGTAGSVDMDDDAQLQLMIKLESGGFDGELVTTKGRVDPSEIRCWTHSHPGKGESATFWSSIDDGCIERFLTGPWCVSIVFDENGDHPKCRIDSKEPRMQITADLQLYVPYLTDSEEKKAKDLFKETSSKKSFGSGQYVGGVYRSNQPYKSGAVYKGTYSPNNKTKTTTVTSSTKTTTTSTTKAGTTSKASSGYKPESVAKVDKDDEAGISIQKRIMSLFSLRADQVEEDWIRFAKDEATELGEFSYTGTGQEYDEDCFDAGRSIEFYENRDTPDLYEGSDSLTARQLADMENADDGGAGQTQIPFVGDLEDGFEWFDGLQEVSAQGELVGEELEDEGTAGALDLETLTDEVEEDVEVTHDTVPDATIGTRMKSHAVSAGLDALAQAVVDNEISVVVALQKAQINHNITAEQAESALGERLGG